MHPTPNKFPSPLPAAAWLALFAFSLCASSIGCHRSTTKDYSSPKAAALTWLHAMLNGDAAGMKDASINADPSQIDIFAKLVRAHAELVKTATDKFGSAANKLFANSSFVPDNSAQIESAGITINGDTASLRFAGEEHMKFKKVSGDWKVDCTDDPFFGKSLPGPPNSGIWQSVINVDRQLTDGIRSGKYATLEDAAQARRKMIAESATP